MATPPRVLHDHRSGPSGRTPPHRSILVGRIWIAGRGGGVEGKGCAGSKEAKAGRKRRHFDERISGRGARFARRARARAGGGISPAGEGLGDVYDGGDFLVGGRDAGILVDPAEADGEALTDAEDLVGWNLHEGGGR